SYAEGAARVHLASDATADLDGLQSTSERLGERAFDEPLEPALEPLESHRGRCYLRFAVFFRLVGGRIGRRNGWYAAWSTREWRNWQTRRIQVPVAARLWGFKSPLAHSPRPVRDLGSRSPRGTRGLRGSTSAWRKSASAARLSGTSGARSRPGRRPAGRALDA